MLRVVLALNATMFVVGAIAGILGRSTALLGDSLDMFGDAAVYGVTLYVFDKGAVWRAKASLMKGIVMTTLGIGVLIEAVFKALGHGTPHAGTMGAVATLSLAVNMACLVLLWSHRGDDINLQSAWVCSRNDIVANVGVIVAAVAVRLGGSWWPDVAVGGGIAVLCLFSAVSILRDGFTALRSEAHHNNLSPERVR